jgi:hypothetical protein
MKNILKLFAVSLALVVGSCNFIDPELNIDPNNPLDVPVNLLLPAAQVNLAYAMGGDLGRTVAMWTQHHAGVDRQSTGFDVYQLREQDINNVWGNLYAGTLTDLQAIVRKAEETESPYYRGVAKTLIAFTMGHVVDLWNDVPFSDALKGAEQLKPAYDTGESVYDQIRALLRDAKLDFAAPASVLKPGTDDLIFGGSMAKWTAFANTLLARSYLRVDDFGNALAAIDEGAIADNAGNAMVVFGTATTEQNPWFQFDDQRGDQRMGKFFIDLMVSIDDPRLPFFSGTDANGNYVGSGAGEYNVGASVWGDYYCGDASPVAFATYAETKFIEAEAAFASNKERAANAYNDALAASLGQLGIDDPAFLAQEAADAGSITLQKILTHKYIACYTTLEPYADWRRTGLPALTPAAGTTEIARRFPYPGDERLYNSDNYAPYAGTTVFDRVFWDN